MIGQLVDGLIGGENSKRGLVAVASPTSVDTFLATRLLLVAFNLPDSVMDTG
jgi:hypothetical protein